MSDTSRELPANKIDVCPICGGTGSVYYADLQDGLHFCPGRWNFQYCPNCESYWLDPRPTLESIEAIYPDNYYTHSEPWDKLGSGGRFASILKPAKRAFLHHAYEYPKPDASLLPDLLGRMTASTRYIRNLKGDVVRFLPPVDGGTLLDIGCANGEFLLTMAKLGWKVRGIEPDPTSAAIARKHGLEVETSIIEDSKYLTESRYDAITMSHVIEHLSDPQLAVSRISESLKKRGRFVSISPNPRSAMIPFVGSGWLGWQPPRHLTVPSGKALKRMAIVAGLEPAVWTRTPTPWVELNARASLGISRYSDASAYKGRWLPKLIVTAIRAIEITDNSRGDEVVLIAQKP